MWDVIHSSKGEDVSMDRPEPLQNPPMIFIGKSMVLVDTPWETNPLNVHFRAEWSCHREPRCFFCKLEGYVS